MTNQRLSLVWNITAHGFLDPPPPPHFPDTFGSSQTWLFLTWAFAISTWKRSFAPFRAHLRSFADLRLRSFALLLRYWACFCVRLHVDGNCRHMKPPYPQGFPDQNFLFVLGFPSLTTCPHMPWRTPVQWLQELLSLGNAIRIRLAIEVCFCN